MLCSVPWFHVLAWRVALRVHSRLQVLANLSPCFGCAIDCSILACAHACMLGGAVEAGLPPPHPGPAAPDRAQPPAHLLAHAQQSCHPTEVTWKHWNRHPKGAKTSVTLTKITLCDSTA
eukprot:820946-Rhodomonas_salina.1